MSAVVILCENFAHVFQEAPGQTEVTLRPGVLEDERVNPNGFVDRVVLPIVDTLQRIDGTKTWRICSASWAAGLARASTGRDVVDVGSSKCLRVRCDGDSVVQVAVAPSVTIPLAAAKAAHFGISLDLSEEGGREALVQQQYLKLLPFLRDCARDQARMVATEGVRLFCEDAQVPTYGLTMQALLAAPQNPMAVHHAAASDADVAALAALPVQVLSGEDEGNLEFVDAVGKTWAAGSHDAEGAGMVTIVFASMGGSSTQVCVCGCVRERKR